MLNIFFLVAGLGALVWGAEMLVRGGARLAARLGVSSLVIGLTIVAYGTSSPELAVSAKAAILGQSDIALGNVVGSNIFNVLFILGVSALISPLVISKQLVKVDVPIMILVSVLLYIFSLDGKLGRLDGIILLLGIIIYSAFAVTLSKREARRLENNNLTKESFPKDERSASSIVKNIVLCLIGLGVLVVGAKFFVSGAVAIARTLGVSDLVIALTIVAAGTSLPEVATSIMATLRGERDIAVGNVIGSNIFNILGIMGVSILLAGPAGITVSPGVLDFDLPVMLAVVLASLPIFFSGHRIERWEGFIFILYYIAYVSYLILKSEEHDMLPFMNGMMFAFVIPLTLLTLVVVYCQSHFKLRKG